ncbi:MAG: phosphatidate cytidylyltransferase, partial [Gammaproteobacteria bacterium]
GKHKLSPYVSPGKTWEGVIGAFIAVAVLGFVMAEYEFFSLLNPVLLSAVGVAVAAVSVGGDLFESKIKRERGVKDSGNLLPGHGGVYDRIDSLIAAAPVYLLGIMMINGGTL